MGMGDIMIEVERLAISIAVGGVFSEPPTVEVYEQASEDELEEMISNGTILVWQHFKSYDIDRLLTVIAIKIEMLEELLKLKEDEIVDRLEQMDSDQVIDYIQENLASRPSLNPCPCCGGADVLFISSLEVYYMDNQVTLSIEEEAAKNTGWYVICNAQTVGCGMMSGWSSSKEGARKAWNRRVALNDKKQKGMTK